jgi:hypothetical protein
MADDCELEADYADSFPDGLRKRFVGEEVDAQFEVWALELRWQWGELADGSDATPAGAVDGRVLTGSVEVHSCDAAVGEDGKADKGFALLVERWPRLFGDQGYPVALDVFEDLSDVGSKVDALSVGEDLGPGTHTLTASAWSTGSVVSSGVSAGGILSCFADCFTWGLIWGAEVWTRWRGLGRLDQGLLRGLWRWRRLRGGGSWGLRSLDRRRLDWRWRRRFSPAHLLQPLQRLLVELLGVALLGNGLGGLRSRAGQVFGRVEEGQLFIAFLENVNWTDKARLVEEDPRAVEEKPDDTQVNDDGDVDRFAKARFGAFVVEGVEKMDKLMFLKLTVTACAHLHGMSGRRGVGWRLEGGHRL